MTTVVSPGSGETSYFNKGGVAIVSLTCGTAGTDPVIDIPADAGTVVAILNSTSGLQSPSGFKVDSAFQVGDVLEVQVPSYGPGVIIYASDGVTVLKSGVNPSSGLLIARLLPAGWVFNS